MHKNTVGIVGLGMVGEPLLRYLEQYRGYQRGNNLFCYDVDPNKGYQDNLQEKTPNIIFVSVPTPSVYHEFWGECCDTSIVENTVQKCAEQKEPPLVVIRSTVVPGTCEELAQKYHIRILYIPEFLTEANAWEDFLHPDRQIVGATIGSEHYAPIVMSLMPKPNSGELAQLIMNATEAEFVKYRSNLFGALKVVFANQVAVLAQLYSKALGVSMDEKKILHAIGFDHRIGHSWLDVDYHDYRGYGGYCFTKDTNAQIVQDRKILLRTLNNSDVDDELRKLAGQTIRSIEADRDCNRMILRSQGLTEEDVSKHDAELAEKLKKRT